MNLRHYLNHKPNSKKSKKSIIALTLAIGISTSPAALTTPITEFDNKTKNTIFDKSFITRAIELSGP